MVGNIEVSALRLRTVAKSFVFRVREFRAQFPAGVTEAPFLQWEL
jgi:hypothetical protein